MREITIKDIDALKIGSGILGSGGGGDPYVGALMAKSQMEKYGPVKMIRIEEMKDTDIIVPVGFMGAPSVSVERLASGDEFDYIFQEIKQYTGKRPTVVFPVEIGGSNAFTPFCIAGKMGLPILDADGMGRAFPELQMVSFTLFDLLPQAAFLSDLKGNTAIINARNNDDDNLMIESMGRVLTVTLGSAAGLVICVLAPEQVQQSVIPSSISWAIDIGNAVLDARVAHEDPVNALIKVSGGRLVGSGIMEDIDQKIEAGFLKGTVTVVDSDTKKTFKMEYQNENLVLYENDALVATTPDIIIPVDAQTAEPITSESLKYGLRVSLVVIPCHELWKTKRGLDLVGPRYFGYDFDYKPFEK